MLTRIFLWKISSVALRNHFTDTLLRDREDRQFSVNVKEEKKALHPSGVEPRNQFKDSQLRTGQR